MKFLIIFAALASVALAEFHLFVEDREIVNEITEKININHITLKKGDAREVIVKSPKNAIDDLITAFIEKNRELMPDPITSERLALRLNQPLIFRLDLGIENIIIAGLRNFVIDNIKFNLLRMSFDFAFTVPAIDYDSDFDADGRVAMIYPFSLHGVARMRMDEFKIVGRTTLGTTSDNYLTLKTFDLDLDVDKLSIFLEALEGVGPEGALDWLGEKLKIEPEFVDNMFKFISAQMGDLLFDSFNEILGKVKLSDLIG